MPVFLNIHKRLALVLWGAALLTLVAAGAGVVLYHRLTLDERARQSMEPFAQLVSVGTDTAVAFEDPDRAREILGTLRASPQITGADIFLASGRRLAGFSRSDGERPGAAPARPDGIHIDGDKAELLQTLPSGARLRVDMDLKQLDAQARQTLWGFAAGALLLLAFTLAQLAILRRTVARPIALLTEATERVHAEADYRHRVPASGTDEVARLGRSFNDMLETIQRREDDLLRLSLFQRTILDNVAYGIISVAPDGIVTSFNAAAEHLLGYAAEEIVGRLTPTYWHDPVEIARRAVELSGELGETIQPGFDVFTARPRRRLPEEREWTFIRQDGKRIPVTVSVTALRDESDRITGFVGMTVDLTERKQFEQELARHRHHLEEEVATRTRELAEARDAADAANRAKSAFLARMSHELRTPLNGVLGYAQILLRKPTLDERMHRGLTVIQQSGEQLLTLINDILDLAKIEAGKRPLYPAPLNLHAFLRAISDIVAVRAEGKNLRFSCVTAPDLPGGVLVDERILRQALLNLLSNAVRFTEQGTVTLNVGVLPSGRLRFVVADTGVGIAPEDQDRIFQPFEQAGDGQRQSGGTGLGLAIVREFVRLLDSEICVESCPGEGSTFWFDVDLPVVAARDAPSSREFAIGYAGPRKKILVVDDVAVNRALIEAQLEPLGFEVAQAADGFEGVKQALALRPDLILMDTVMPRMDGNEATRRLRATPGFENLPIIAVSASATAGDQEETLRASANAFLPKPVDLDSLLEQIAALLHLDLIRQPGPGPGSEAAVTDGVFVAPPAAEMEVFHGLALQGDMRGIGLKAEELAAHDAACRPFADRLRQLAAEYQSQALLNLIEQHMSTFNT